LITFVIGPQARDDALKLPRRFCSQ